MELEKKVTVHRLVGNAFLENPDNKKIIDHIDNNPANNNVKNLRFCSQKENLYNQFKTKTNTSGFKGVVFDKPLIGIYFFKFLLTLSGFETVNS